MRLTKRRLLIERSVWWFALYKLAASSWYEPRIWKIDNTFCRKF